MQLTVKEDLVRRSLALLLAPLLLLPATASPATAASAASAPSASAEAQAASITYRTIPGEGGAPLRAFVVAPTGSGPHPLLVMPSSWAVSGIEYVGAAAKLAYRSGYAVISYTSRGFHDSGGEIDVAGTATVADVSRVIDWGITNLDADPARIGVAGISYGGGQSLLAAAADPRVRAVAALSTWSDLARSLYPNETVSSQAVDLLLTAGKLTGRPGQVLRDAETAYREGRFEDVVPISPPRSPSTKVPALSRAAVLIGNAWNDGLFPPGQITDLFSELTGPKRLLLTPGDHATAELFGAAGLPNEVWDAVGRWFDHHLRGVANGVDREAPVWLRPNNGGAWRTYPSWSAVTTARESLPLAEAGFGAGRATLADSGAVLVSGALQAFLKIPTGVALPLVDRSGAAVWTGPVLRSTTLVGGTPRARLNVTAAAETSLFAYLYEVNGLGLGALISHKPVVVRAGSRVVDLELEPALWQVGAGNRLALVVDTVDGRYGSVGTRGAAVTIGAGSVLEVPISG
ncbi:X-Pro dipeptidyl-peptidase [Actinosynnema pretiosum subsp. pretiosum]|uniref:X-Pro dipeptidyl-peptidase n=1 Tax=Actinosynnema pretiosum subsp. pretiosum TaxID=103721 RepID=A0AA45LDP1_9PSEU|nr:X-Pro dipeptidyl-peptidase [Actinosynnema pretiosum subsp. pretiosum]